ncbi:hypothetical protein CspHIS471_0311800 [Cutaneotrichosporon sp. HIS471]|nr:hypothetical protein CspHIS471_0311800 [Cutaneotrichosporon sp. HIS471]
MSEPSPARMDNASHFEEQFSRVIARQNVQDGELAALISQVTNLQAKLRSMGSNSPTPLALSNPAETDRMPDPLSRLEARMDNQDAQIAVIIASRPDSQIAALRAELRDMGRWCERFNSAHHRTLARCAELEIRLGAANEEVARLRDAARVASARFEEQEQEKEKEKGNTPVHRQVAVVRQDSTGSTRNRSRRNSGRKVSSPPLPSPN